MGYDIIYRCSAMLPEELSVDDAILTGSFKYLLLGESFVPSAQLPMNDTRYFMRIATDILLLDLIRCICAASFLDHAGIQLGCLERGIWGQDQTQSVIKERLSYKKSTFEEGCSFCEVHACLIRRRPPAMSPLLLASTHFYCKLARAADLRRPLV